ncbi:MAG: hypothetical protein Q8R91_03760 [Candidatus Omnitrophota bacterium]|nr:hypothetical protein [Candidatus Omnitrophota bacterium]
MGWALTPELSKKCKKFVLSHWGKDGLEQVMERPVSWVRHQANPHLRHLRRKQKGLPLIAVHGSVNRIHLALSTEKDGPTDPSGGKRGTHHA